MKAGREELTLSVTVCQEGGSKGDSKKEKGSLRLRASVCGYEQVDIF